MEIKAIPAREKGRPGVTGEEVNLQEEGNAGNVTVEAEDAGKKKVGEREEEDREVTRRSREISVDRLLVTNNYSYI